MLNWCQSWVIVREKWNTEASEFTLNPEVEEVEVKEVEEVEEVEVVEVVEEVEEEGGLRQELECGTTLTGTMTTSA